MIWIIIGIWGVVLLVTAFYSTSGEKGKGAWQLFALILVILLVKSCIDAEV